MALLRGGSSFPIGRNAVFCSLRYNMCVDSIGDNNLTGGHWFELFNSKLNIHSTDRATALREIIFVREGLCEFSGSDFGVDDASALVCLLARS